MFAVKENRQYTISPVDKDSFVKDGYDIYEDGKIIAYGKGKTIAYEKYAELLEKCEELEKEIADLKAKKAKKTEK